MSVERKEEKNMKIYQTYAPKSLEKKYFANEQAMLNFFEKALSKEIKKAKKEMKEYGWNNATVELKLVKKYKKICAYEINIINGKKLQYPLALVGNCCDWSYRIINVKE